MSPSLLKSVLFHLDPVYTQKILADMVSIRSIIGEEKKLAEYIYTELKKIGIEASIQEVEPGRPNVYARIKGKRPGKRLHLNGHMDTVPVCEGWSKDPFDPLIIDNRMYGLGSCDMKAGLACLLNVLRAFQKSGNDFGGELSFSAVVDEEAYSKGTLAALETDFAGCDAVLIPEAYPATRTTPTPLGITGKVLYNITVKGHASHAFLPHEGINAVEEAAKIIAALDRLNLREHPDFGRGNYSTIKIEGGYQIYSVVVPDRCRFEVNRMLVPGETSQMALEDMRKLVNSLDLRSEVDIELKPPVYESFKLERQQEIVQIFDEVYSEVMGRAPQYAYTSVITDASVFAGKANIPTLHLGPPMNNIHQPDEFVELNWLEPISRMYAMMAYRFLSDQEK